MAVFGMIDRNLVFIIFKQDGFEINDLPRSVNGSVGEKFSKFMFAVVLPHIVVMILIEVQDVGLLCDSVQILDFGHVCSCHSSLSRRYVGSIIIGPDKLKSPVAGVVVLRKDRHFHTFNWSSNLICQMTNNHSFIVYPISRVSQI
jgi:hypothetical protein